MADSDSDEAPEIGTIAALAGDVSSDEEEDVTPPMPVLFLSHGGGPCIHTSVADAPQFEGIDKDSSFAAFYNALGKLLPKPRRILVVSAHWQEDGYRVTSHDCPGLEYDYFGFPKHLHSLEYRPPGDPKFAKKLSKLLHKEGFPTKLTRRKGLDSGTFVPLLALFPTGHIPVIQLSLRDTHDFAEHVAVGKVLSQFRQYGTLIIGSGQATHNYRTWGEYGITSQPVAWAWEFQEWLRQTMLHEDPEERCRRWSVMYGEAPHARIAHPTPEHILPAAVVAGAVALPPNDSGNPLAGKEVYDGWIRGCMSLACYRYDNVRRAFFDGVFDAGDRPETSESVFSRPWSQ